MASHILGSNKKLLVTSASLLGTSELLGSRLLLGLVGRKDRTLHVVKPCRHRTYPALLRSRNTTYHDVVRIQVVDVVVRTPGKKELVQASIGTCSPLQ